MIVILLKLLKTADVEMIVAVTGAIMSLTTEVDAKKTIVRENGMEIMKALLDHIDERVLVNVVQIMANCAEDYRARFMLQTSLPQVSCCFIHFHALFRNVHSPHCFSYHQQLNQFLEHSNEQLRETTRRAISVITWRP